VSAADPAVPGQQIPAIPVAFVAVKDVVVRADWSGADAAALPGAAGLGPFVMAGAGFSAQSGTLSIPGVQAIAYVCEVPRLLPPRPPA
jgi:hypothetical protein